MKHYPRKKGNRIRPSSSGAYYFEKADTAAGGILSSSRQMTDYQYANDILQPPYEPKDLIALIERNDSLKQNIEALASNVANFGHGIKYQDDFDRNTADEAAQKQADAEWDILRRLYRHMHPLLDFSALVYKMAIDMYSFGWGLLEVLRDGAGQVKGLEYARACNFRLVQNRQGVTPITVWEETEDGYALVENYVRFKKFVQLVNGKKVYFREFGDPRPMNRSTGEYAEAVPDYDLATELAYFPIHSSYTDYGVPHWINTAITASGNIMSEVLNCKYFQDGRILPMAVIVSGGALTDGSVAALSEGKGIDNAYKTLLLEAAPFEDGDEEKGAIARNLQPEKKPSVSVDIKPLTDTTNKDALFREYQRDGKEKIRDSLRLPPIYTGAASDYNRATADTARMIAEEQIFVPERKRITDVFNKIINNERGIRYVSVFLKGPDMNNAEQKAQMLSVLNAAGAVTPNMLLPLAEEALGGKDIEPWSEEEGNIPFELLKLRQTPGMPDLHGQPEDEGIAKSAGEMVDALEGLTEAIRREMAGEASENEERG